jgi:LPS export ABC transporter protein LptC
MDIRPLLQLSTVLIAVSAGAYYGWGGLTADNVVTDNSGKPDYIVEQVQLWQTDSQGNLLRRMQGEQLTHHPSPERFHLTQPDIQLYSKGLLLWRLTAKQADSPNPASDVWLSGQVVAQRLSSTELLRLETSRLHADPKGNRLDTPEKVTIISSKGNISGIGMSTDLQAKSVELKSSVEVRYAPSY